MKLLSSGLMISALFIASVAHAEMNAADVPATLTITGTVSGDTEARCTLGTSVSSLYLRGDVSNLINQGDTADSMSFVPFHIEGNTQCDALIEQGRLSYRFLGTADDSLGSALANTSSGENAATGVAIGLFDNTGKPVSINGSGIAVSQNSGQGVGFQVVKLKDRTATAGTVHGVLTIDIERL
ncbi:type 1 fimbrial protein [Cronobacter turicensis]|uniref:Type 1 fimbrial protein n=2 Tax=Cronobacter turicensis TaxID=413502 RepID=A0A2T7BB35_9ENTR|nr:fimbrial protein [Cronobacter turicensis]PUX27121.1 type 1 fimbrial protein [Cronobacter turicensis]PUX40385.1 type 1 fimbrial protein [Cronobacter turicensis]